MSTTKTTEPQGSFPLTANNLTNLVRYTPHPSGLSLTSLTSLPSGSLFAPIKSYTLTPHPTPLTLQISRDKHITLDSAFTYLNHSCDPSLEIDVEKMEIRVARGRNLEEGEELTFFYPSTEWSMDRPFECLCGKGEKCVGVLRGAEGMKREELQKWFVNKYIWELVDERDAKKI